MLRQEQGRAYLASAMADIRYGAKRQRLLQAIAGVFQCQALLHRWGSSMSQQCLHCRGEAETIGHIQNWWPALKEEHIAAHHSCAAMVLWAFQAHSVSRGAVPHKDGNQQPPTDPEALRSVQHMEHVDQ